jgi:hypothetical protein
VRRSDRLRDLQSLVPALCAGIHETLRHSVLPGDLPFDLGTSVAVVLVPAISFGFAHVSFGMIRRTEERLRERNRELQALSRRVERLAVIEERDRLLAHLDLPPQGQVGRHVQAALPYDRGHPHHRRHRAWSWVPTRRDCTSSTVRPALR